MCTSCVLQGTGMDFKQLVGSNWVDPPERKRKRANYAENDFYRNQVGKVRSMKEWGMATGIVGLDDTR